MGKSTNGPTMHDIGPAMSEIAQDWSSSITFLIELDGSQGGCGLFIHALCVPLMPRLLDGEPGASATIRWPDREGRTFEGSMLNLLYQLDSILAKAAMTGSE